MTPKDFKDWLKNPHRRPVVLVHAEALVGGVRIPIYLSDQPYASDSVQYLARLHGNLHITERMATDFGGSASLAAVDIQIINTDGKLDYYLDFVWVNRPVSVLMGDAAWPVSDFVTLFSGIVADIDSPSPSRLALKTRDELQRLNAPITETTLGGTSDNKDRLLPIAIGHVFNASPLLIDASQHQYRLHQGAVTQIVEVRDNGSPVSFTANLASGTFKLNQSPFGTITADVIAPSGTVIEAITLLSTQYGKPSERFAPAELDLPPASLYPQPIGLYLPDRDNLLQTIQRIAASIGGQVVMTRAGKLGFVRLDAPAATPVATLGGNDIIAGSLSLSDRPPVSAGVKLGYAHNATLQSSGMAGGIPEPHLALYAAEWQTVNGTNTAVKADYLLHADAEQTDSALVRRSDAAAESARRLALVSTPRIAIKLTLTAAYLSLSLGDTVEIVHHRFGLSSGKRGIVINAEPDIKLGKTTLVVLIYQSPPTAHASSFVPLTGYAHSSVATLQAASPRLNPVTLPPNLQLNAGTVVAGVGTLGSINTAAVIAQSTAATATATATAAQSAANSAASSAAAAQSSASTAASTAAAASSAASSASSSSSTALALAQSALALAQSADGKATSALSLAQSVDRKATSALSLAQTAYGPSNPQNYVLALGARYLLRPGSVPEQQGALGFFTVWQPA